MHCQTDLYSGMVSERNLKEDLEGFFWDIDEDLNGNNGREYKSKECIERGFNCDLEMFIHDAIKKYEYEPSFAFESVCDDIYNSSSYYNKVEYKCIEPPRKDIVDKLKSELKNEENENIFYCSVMFETCT